eukprot:SM000006S19516  [mRNA]  locus=s6:1218981:1221549:- [translate_table: standard]
MPVASALHRATRSSASVAPPPPPALPAAFAVMGGGTQYVAAAVAATAAASGGARGLRARGTIKPTSESRSSYGPKRKFGSAVATAGGGPLEAAAPLLPHEELASNSEPSKPSAAPLRDLGLSMAAMWAALFLAVCVVSLGTRVGFRTAVAASTREELVLGVLRSSQLAAKMASTVAAMPGYQGRSSLIARAATIITNDGQHKLEEPLPMHGHDRYFGRQLGRHGECGLRLVDRQRVAAAAYGQYRGLMTRVLDEERKTLVILRRMIYSANFLPLLSNMLSLAIYVLTGQSSCVKQDVSHLAYMLGDPLSPAMREEPNLHTTIAELRLQLAQFEDAASALDNMYVHNKEDVIELAVDWAKLFDDMLHSKDDGLETSGVYGFIGSTVGVMLGAPTLLMPMPEGLSGGFEAFDGEKLSMADAVQKLGNGVAANSAMAVEARQHVWMYRSIMDAMEPLAKVGDRIPPQWLWLCTKISTWWHWAAAPAIVNNSKTVHRQLTEVLYTFQDLVDDHSTFRRAEGRVAATQGRL